MDSNWDEFQHDGIHSVLGGREKNPCNNQSSDPEVSLFLSSSPIFLLCPQLPIPQRHLPGQPPVQGCHVQPLPNARQGSGTGRSAPVCDILWGKGELTQGEVSFLTVFVLVLITCCWQRAQISVTVILEIFQGFSFFRLNLNCTKKLKACCRAT